MEKPATQKELVFKIWQMLDGVNDDGLYHEVKRLVALVDKFINNTGNIRRESCPIKQQFENHLIEHKKSEIIINDSKEFTLKKWHALCAGLAIMVAVAFGVINYFK